jgi:PiT family inorganic phosphate transporter
MALDVSAGVFVLGVALSYAYAFVGGFTDAANAIATAIGTRAFTPAQAVALAGLLELGGALTGTAVATTIGQGIVSPEALPLVGVCAALLATLSWSLVTFWRGIPVSETHGLVGGIIGAAIGVGGSGVVHWSSVAAVTTAIVVSPLLGFAGATVLLVALYRAFSRVHRGRAMPVFVQLQRVSSAYMAFSHGRNDAQKPMGVLALALASYHGSQTVSVPLWIIVSVAMVAALGVASGGWRIIRTLGLRVTALDPVQGFAAEMSAASVLQAASSFGIPVSTTHAITSAIVGAGTVQGRTRVRWRLVGEISLSWVLTLPVTVALGFLFHAMIAPAFRGH